MTIINSAKCATIKYNLIRLFPLYILVRCCCCCCCCHAALFFYSIIIILVEFVSGIHIFTVFISIFGSFGSDNVVLLLPMLLFHILLFYTVVFFSLLYLLYLLFGRSVVKTKCLILYFNHGMSFITLFLSLDSTSIWCVRFCLPCVCVCESWVLSLLKWN